MLAVIVLDADRMGEVSRWDHFTGNCAFQFLPNVRGRCPRRKAVLALFHQHFFLCHVIVFQSVPRNKNCHRHRCICRHWYSLEAAQLSERTFDTRVQCPIVKLYHFIPVPLRGIFYSQPEQHAFRLLLRSKITVDETGIGQTMPKGEQRFNRVV